MWYKTKKFMTFLILKLTNVATKNISGFRGMGNLHILLGQAAHYQGN
jgi:hypothetical protein